MFVVRRFKFKRWQIDNTLIKIKTDYLYKLIRVLIINNVVRIIEKLVDYFK